MARILTLGSSVSSLNSVNIDKSDKIYIAKSGDELNYSIQMSEFVEYLKKASGSKKAFTRDYSVTLQQKYGYSATSTSSDFFNALASDCAKRDFSKIEFGDIMYMPVTWNGATVNKWMVIGINHYDGIYNRSEYGKNGIKPGIVFRACFPLGSAAHNTTDSNTIGWKGSLIRAKFSGSGSAIGVSVPVKTAGLNYTLNQACGGHLQKISRYLGNTNDRDWILDYAFLPTEIETYGQCHWTNEDYYSSSRQFGLYREAPHQILVESSESATGNSTVWYWLAQPATVGGTLSFCDVNDYGNAYSGVADDDTYVVPCWYFGAGD